MTASGGTVSGGIALDPVVVTGQGSDGDAISGYVARGSVTASRTGATILETPQSVGVVGRQEMEDRNVQTRTQALQYMPGVFASTSPISQRFDYFSVRGALLHGWARCRRPRPRFRLDRPPCPTITTALMLRAVFRLALRQTEGLLASILHLLGLDLPVPDHSTLARRARTVTLASLPRSAGGPLHLLVDSTGLKLWGAGRMADREARHQKAALLAGAAHRPGRRERPDCRGHADGPRC